MRLGGQGQDAERRVGGVGEHDEEDDDSDGGRQTGNCGVWVC